MFLIWFFCSKDTAMGGIFTAMDNANVSKIFLVSFLLRDIFEMTPSCPGMDLITW